MKEAHPVTRDAVIGILQTCYDPEIPIDLWNLGLIYDVQLEADGEGTFVDVLMSLTTRGCGMGPHIASDVKSKLEKLAGVSGANVTMTFDPPWTPERMSDVAREKLGFNVSRRTASPQTDSWE